VRITVLGKSPAWQDSGGACSGYLVEDGDTCLLVDCGSGVFSKLRCVREYVDVDAVVVTHMHADHFLDLIPFACALTYAPRQQPEPVDGWPGTDDPARPRLFVPPGAIALLSTIVSAGGQSDLLDSAFAVAEYDVGTALQVGSLTVRFQPVPHFVPANAVDVRGASGARFTFGGDHGPTDALDDFAAATDLLMLEATLSEAEREGPRGHLTASEAGEHAARCAAARLVLTHISDELDGDRARTQAQRAFGGPVELAHEGAVYEL
jgi:ribonuclease BN (tRNA processing enzyme)